GPGGLTYDKPNWDMQLAVTAKVLPKLLPYGRCPSDGFDTKNPAFSNYIGSQGPQCNQGPCSPLGDPFEVNCHGKAGTGNPNAFVNTHPGYLPSLWYGDTSDAAMCRGIMCRGAGAVGGPLIRIADVTDGTTNTIMLGEGLVGQMEFQRFGNSWGWAGFN